MNDRRTLELNMDETILDMVDLTGQFTENSKEFQNSGMQFINSHVVRLFQFNQTHLFDSSSTVERYENLEFTVTFHHWVESDSLRHECFHFTRDNLEQK